MTLKSIAPLLLPILLCGCVREPGVPIIGGIPDEEFRLIPITPGDSCFQPLENYCVGTECESYARAVQRMRVDENERECGYAVSGKCGAFAFTSQTDGLTSRTMYFDATGAAIAVRLSSDFIDRECGGWRYYGPRVTCEQVVTRNYCR